LALWDECTDEPESCCGPAECYGDSGYAACVPKDEMVSDEPSMSPSDVPSASPSASPTQPVCVECDDTPTGSMIRKGETCVDAKNLGSKCARDNWKTKKFCSLSCYNSGHGYEVCCNGIV